MRTRLPLALSSLALAIALLGVTPAEAVRVVKHALFSDNSGAVNGIHASRTPKPGRLLPLGSNGRFPASAIPPLPVSRGPVGPAGPAGPQGPPGPSSARIISPANVALSRNVGVPVTVATMNGNAAGSYLAVFTGEASMRNSGGIYVICEIRVNGTKVSGTKGIVGDSYGGDEVMSDITAISRDAQFDLAVVCSPDQTTTSLPSGPEVDQPKLVLIRLDSVATS